MNKDAIKAGHHHAEAFMIMWYVCDCGHSERIWNSRDGVTPFACNCPSCGDTMKHQAWDLDEFAPNHKLHAHQRFWRDGTPDEAERFMRQKIEAFRKYNVDNKFSLLLEKEEKLIEEARNGGHSFSPGWPFLDTNS